MLRPERLGLAISVLALGVSALAFWDSHRVAEARLSPRKELLAHGIMIGDPGKESRPYTILLCNRGNRKAVLLAAYFTVAPQGEYPQLYQALSEPAYIEPQDIAVVKLHLPIHLHEPCLKEGAPKAKEGFMALRLNAVWSDGQNCRLTYLEEDLEFKKKKIPEFPGFLGSVGFFSTDLPVYELRD